VDALKGLTYSHGWQVVDETLRRLARWLGDRAASLGGAAVRVGGDEFLILLSGDCVALARAAAERLVAECQTLGLPYGHPGTARRTFSVSAAVCLVDASTDGKLAALRESMEDAIWRAKQRLGRDFGVVAEERDHGHVLGHGDLR
jgi:GGDEF domain-containing protein